MLFTDREKFHHQLRSGLLTSTPKAVHIDGFHRAAVLVPVIWTGEYELLFTKRTETVETHKGQISFPGGMVDSGDRDIVHTALREASEELGIQEGMVSVEGTLDDLPTPSGFVITPVVGIIDALPVLSLNLREVAEAFHLPLAFFADPAAGRLEMREFRGAQREVWFYEHGSHVIWGATAMIVRSLLKSLGIV
jgi:8-oxo-dGTP pyrophosphatase MutT (NUDIX family)